MVLDIFQLLMSDVTHLKRLKRLEIYWKFQSPGVSVSTAGHISREISKICGNSLQVKQKKKSAWSATYWEDDEERDVEE